MAPTERKESQTQSGTGRRRNGKTSGSMKPRLLTLLLLLLVYALFMSGMMQRVYDRSTSLLVDTNNDGPFVTRNRFDDFAATNRHTIIRHSNETTLRGDSPKDSFSACLIIMDENFRLREWLAYHYHVLPLRSVVVIVDPRSKESPSEIFDLFRQELGMDILIWADEDIDYEVDVNSTDDHQKRADYIVRQRLFLNRCMTHFHKQGHRWTLMTDTDEYLTTEPGVEKYPSFESIMGTDYFHQPGAVLEYLHHVQIRGVFNESCIIAHRILFGAVQNGQYIAPSVIPKGLEVDPFRLDTVRWRWHNKRIQNLNGLGKPMIDVSALQFPLNVRNPHRPDKRLCGRPYHGETARNSPFRVNHYLGSWEEYSYRDDARKNADRSREVRLAFVLCRIPTQILRPVLWLKT